MNFEDSSNNNQFNNMLESTGKVDYFGTHYMSFQKRYDIYQQEYKKLKDIKTYHKGEIQSIKLLKNSTQNVMDFKKDEINKKMKNEIYRLSEESRRHEETQNNENNKINQSIDEIQDKSHVNEVHLMDILYRVMNLERNLGPDLRNEKIKVSNPISK